MIESNRIIQKTLQKKMTCRNEDTNKTYKRTVNGIITKNYEQMVKKTIVWKSHTLCFVIKNITRIS